MLQVQGLCANRGGKPLFSNVVFSLAAGESLHLQGPNGVGKTTLLKILAGISPLQQGQVQLRERTLADWGDEYGAQFHYLGHRDALKETLSPLENLHIHARLNGVDLGDEAALNAIVQVGLAACVDLPVRHLSQGQKRRATLARFLALPRAVWILDEPFVALDVAGQSELGTWIAAHLQRGGIAILTSHQAIPSQIPSPRILQLHALTEAA